MDDASTDQALLHAVESDPAAFAHVFDRHAKAIFRYAAHRVGRSLAEDVLAETFTRAFAARHRAYTTNGSLRAWLYAIARNLIADELRRRARFNRAEDRLKARPAPPEPEPGVGTDPELLHALRELREEEREALLLLAWGELSYGEIAVVTGVAIGTVRSRLNRARSRVRAALNEATWEVA
jgi:RNA polymerase sigma factor (sigma-70 family)